MNHICQFLVPSEQRPILITPYMHLHTSAQVRNPICRPRAVVATVAVGGLGSAAWRPLAPPKCAHPLLVNELHVNPSFVLIRVFGALIKVLIHKKPQETKLLEPKWGTQSASVTAVARARPHEPLVY